MGLTDSAGVEEGYPAAAEIHAKLKVIAEADDRLRHFLPLPEDYEYPKDLDDLGRSRGESSYIAVVHADGDGTAQYMRSIGKRYGSAQQNRAYIEALREFSAGITATAQTALQKTLEKLIVAIKGEKIQHPSPDAAPSIVPIKLKRSKRGKLLLAFRPIVFAGDDITFVSDGRIGLSLAIEYLHQFEASSKIFLGKLSGQEPTKYLTSSAGVAIVKSHYPFARSYHLSEALSRSAKEYRRKMGSGSFIDWHFASTGIVGELAEIRETEYQVGAGSLTLRPVGVEGNLEEEVRAWPAIHRVIEDFQTSEVWTGRRNKLKALRSALREGPEAVERFLTLYDLERLPELRPGYHDFQKRGWHGRLCGYFDAIELADHFIPCSSKENMAGTAASPQD
ncbi:MAG: hypothetical protein M1553_01045 [Firmicutes bacterium]|nr:hypothetical protein [Bacillota bacterium]